MIGLQPKVLDFQATVGAALTEALLNSYIAKKAENL